MNAKLKDSPQIWRLAVDLGLRPHPDPVSAIIEFCRNKVRNIANQFGCTKLSGLLDAVAAALGTKFVEIHTEADLKATQDEYLRMGEKAFATLHEDLGDNALAITYRRIARRHWEPPFVSVIDCRGKSCLRAYYSKWHELAHLLTLTDQLRLSFTRTHSQIQIRKEPEEALMEVIAGTFGFWNEIVAKQDRGRISFKLIEQLRREQCPEASVQASVIGFVRAWVSPCLLIQAELSPKARDTRKQGQSSFRFADPHTTRLRAVKVTANDAAKRMGLFVYQNMRIPEYSVIYKIFSAGSLEGSSVEDLGNWTTSNGGKLSNCPIFVEARRSWNGVEALVMPLDAE